MRFSIFAFVALCVSGCHQNQLSSEFSSDKSVASVFVNGKAEDEGCKIPDTMDANRLDVEITSCLSKSIKSGLSDFDVRLSRKRDDHLSTLYYFHQYYQGIKVDYSAVVYAVDKVTGKKSISASLATHLRANFDQNRDYRSELVEAKKVASEKLGKLGAQLPIEIRDSFLLIKKPDVEIGMGSLTPPYLVLRVAIYFLYIDIIAEGPRQGEVDYVLKDINDANVKLYNASLVPMFPTTNMRGMLVMKNGKLTQDARIAERFGQKLVSDDAKAAAQNFQKTYQFYDKAYGLKSFDGQDSEIVVTVDHGKSNFSMVSDNASWMSFAKLFTISNGESLRGLGSALDVIGHEFTHAVISYSSNLIYESQPGALNEHFADAFGELVQKTYEPFSEPFLIGKGVMRHSHKPMRDMRSSENSEATTYDHLEEVPSDLRAACIPNGANDNCGVHSMSGIPNKVFSEITPVIGWDKMRTFYYKLMTQRMHRYSTFQDYRIQILDLCKTEVPQHCARIEEALGSAGI